MKLLKKHDVVYNDVPEAAPEADKPKKSAKKWICVAAVLVLGLGMYGVGNQKDYDAEYISGLVEEQIEDYPEISEARAAHAAKLEEKAALEKKIDELKAELDRLAEEEAKLEDYDAELLTMAERVEELSAQKEEKQQTIDGLDAELAKY